MSKKYVKILDEGLELIQEHICSLLKSSQILYEQKQYPISLALSVLAHEELSKMKLIIEKNIKNEILTEKEWDRISTSKTHTRKLQGPYIEAIERTKQLGLEHYDIIKKNITKLGYRPRKGTFASSTTKKPEILKNLALLNEIKKDSFHMKFKQSKWYTVQNTRHVRPIAKMERITVLGLFYGYSFVYCNFIINEGNKSSKIIKQRDEYQEKRNHLDEYQKSKTFQKEKMLTLDFLKQYSQLFSKT